MKTRLTTALILLAAVFSGAITFAAEFPVELKKLHDFDISCKIVNHKYGKRICGLRHIEAFGNIIHVGDKAARLAQVEDEIGLAKKNLEKLEELAEGAPEHGFNEEYQKIAEAAQEGNKAAIRKIDNIQDTSLIPYLFNVRRKEGTAPSLPLRMKLAELEMIMDKKISEGGEGLDREVLELAVQRESRYIDSLKRAVIFLEGTRRKYPPWLPFAYAYIVGLIPFFFGVWASILYYGRLEPYALAVCAVVYGFYVCMHGFFQFVAPYI